MQAAQEPPPATKPRQQRMRIPISCTECRKRKQKCNKAKDRPCNHCARRYPPVVCSYDYSKKPEEVDVDASRDRTSDKNLVEQSVEKIAVGRDGDEEVMDGQTADPANNQDVSYVVPRAARVSPTYQEEHPVSEAQRRDKRSGSRKVIHLSGSVDFDLDSSEENLTRYCYNPYLLPRRGNGTYGCPEAFDHHIPMIVEPLHPIPIDNTDRNAELFHFFHLALAPFIGAIDGQEQSLIIKEGWLPWMADSPLLAYTAILSASCYQAEVRGLDVSKSAEAIGIKVKIISIINKYIKANARMVSDEALSAVMHICVNEWYYGDEKSQRAHMGGLGSIVKMRGGVEAFRKNGALYALLVLTDYQIATTTERRLTYTPSPETIPSPSSYLVALESPLLRSGMRFVDLTETLGISTEAASILDDMRFLTSAIVSICDDPNPLETAKIRSTARWIQDRISVLPSISDAAPDSALFQDNIYESCRIVATIFSTAIVSRTPLSKACDMAQLSAFWTYMPQVSRTRWKALSGIYLWLCVVVCPSAQWNVYGRFLKGMVSSSITHIGLKDWNVMLGCLESFLRVQSWLERRGEVGLIGE